MKECSLYDKRYGSISDAYRDNWKVIPVCEQALRRRMTKTGETRIEKLYPQIENKCGESAHNTQNVIIIVTNAEDLNSILDILHKEKECGND